MGLFILSFIAGGLVIFGYVKMKTAPVSQIPPVNKKSVYPDFSIATAPTDSLKGTIATYSGTLLWESRIATIPGELKDTVQIQQGERLITEGKGNALINVNTFGTIILSENTDLSFIQTLPVDFVVRQNKGTVEYVVNGNIPLSVRIRSTIITKTAGTLKITMTDGDPIILISTVQGAAQIGFNDLDYVSQVYTLREGQIYEFNSDERTTINTKNK